MPLFEWNSRYSVGIIRFDREHERLFDLMNQLHDATRIRQERVVLEQVFSELTDYTEQHFCGEEAAMYLSKYPGAAARKAEHDELRDKSKTYMAQFKSGKSKIGIEVVTFLLRWWTDHILRTDRKYVYYLAHRKLASKKQGEVASGSVR